MSVKRFVWPAFELLVVGLVFCCSCTRTSEQYRSNSFVSDQDKMKSPSQGNGKPFPASPVMQDHIFFQFAIYYLPSPDGDPLDCLNELLQTEFKDFQRVDEIVPVREEMLIAANVIDDVQTSYAPPDLETLQRFGRGLSREQAVALQDSQTAVLLDFGYSKKHVWDGMRAALSLTTKFARETGGLLWDEETREVFVPAEWEKERIEDWTEDVPDISSQTVIHAYKKEEYIRAITLGMRKFGLPDIVVDRFSWSLSRNMGHVVNLFAQAMAEGGSPKVRGEFDLDIRTIKNPKVREPQITSLKSNATSVAMLSLREGTWEEGDPMNRLVEITFDRYSGPDLFAQQQEMLGSLFGWEDSVTPVMESQELEDASNRAKAKLPSLRAAFNLGFNPGEFIQVKAPFETHDGEREWMWVEVTSWKGDEITGLLRNEPFNIPSLHAGQEVEVSEATVFDYIRRHADGSMEGNETKKIIEKQNKSDQP
jgi:uncharacterized protein YegJ (DUF2314 family)